MNHPGKVWLALTLVLGLISGCGTNNEAQTNHKTMSNDQDRHIAEEYHQHRAFSNDQSRIRSVDLPTRVANEAERVYSVAEAVAVAQGNDMILGLAFKADALEKKEDIIRRVKERIQNREPEIAGYNLYITEDLQLQQQIGRVRTNLENMNTNGYQIDDSEPDFNDILQRVRNQQ